MNRATVFTFGFLLLLFVGDSGLKGSSQAVITVYTQFDSTYSPASVAEMRQEVATIMGPIGLDFAWRSLPANGSAGEVAAELVVVSLKGRCAMGDEYGAHREAGALGWTHMSDGEILPFTDLDCDRIRRFIYPQMGGAGGEERERIFGRALGRVLAHEMYHIFTKTTRHSAWGVAKAFYTAQELVSDTFLFEAKESKTLREGKVRSLLRHSLQNSFTGQ